MTKLEKKLQVLDELAKKISSSKVLSKDDIREMDTKVSSVLNDVRTEDKRYFKRLS